jgi:hypothetical protein
MAGENVLEKEQADLDKSIKEAPEEARESITKPDRKKLTTNAPPRVVKQEAPVAQDDEDDSDDEGQSTERRVPLARLVEERKKRQERDAEILRIQKEYADDLKRTQQRILDSLPPAPKPVTPEEEPLPDIERDPYNHLLKRTERAEKQVQQAQEWRQHLENQARQQQTVSQVQQFIAQDEATFSTKNPDYADARSHVVEQWRREAEIAGAGPEVVQQYIAQETMKIIQAAAQFNRSPSEIVYNLAKLRGFASAPPDDNDAEAQIAEAARVPQRALQNGPDIDTIQKGLNKSRTPSNSKAVTAPSIQNLLDLDDDEFFEATKGNKWNKLVG